MKASPKKLAYDVKYAKENMRQIKFSFSNKYDADIIAHLDAQKNKQGYIKALIREDIARAKVSTAPAQNILKEDAKMEYKANTLSQSLPIDAQKDALPIRENSPRAKSKKEDKTMNTRISICTINHNTEPDARVTISYDPAQKAIYTDTPGEEDTPIAENLETLEAAEDTCNAMYNVPFWDLEWIEHDDMPAQNPDDPGVPSGGNPWYAVLAASEDNWSKGSFDLDEAKAMAREIRKKHPGAMIAVIDNSLDYPFCSDTITDF